MGNGLVEAMETEMEYLEGLWRDIEELPAGDALSVLQPPAGMHYVPLAIRSGYAVPAESVCECPPKRVQRALDRAVEKMLDAVLEEAKKELLWIFEADASKMSAEADRIDRRAQEAMSAIRKKREELEKKDARKNED